MSGPSNRPRRTFLRTLAVAGTGLAGASSLAAGASGTETSTTTAGDTPTSPLRWQTEVTVGRDCRISAGEGSLYVASPGDDETITALEPDSGETRWEVTDAVADRPVANGKWCFNCGSDLAALSREDGSRAWSTPLPGPDVTGLSLTEDTLYFGWPAGDVLYAVDADSGSEHWTVDRDHCGLPLEVGWSAPEVVDDTVFAHVDDGLAGFDATDGSQRWQVDRPVYTFCGVDGGAVSTHRRAVSAVACDGTVEWTSEQPANVTRVFRVDPDDVGDGADRDDGVVLLRLEGSTGRYRALSRADGEPLWDFETGTHLTTMPAASNGTVYVGDGDGALYAIEAATGDLAATYETEHGLADRPAIVDGTVAVPSREGIVYGFDVRS